MSWLRGGESQPEMPAELATFNEFVWDGDKTAWIRARIEWQDRHMTAEEIARQMERRRLEIRREMLQRLGRREN